MNHEHIAQTDSRLQKTAPMADRILQRKCACGQHTPGRGQCVACAETQKRNQPLQTKLNIGAANDLYEKEADRVANQIMAMSAHPSVSPAAPRIQKLAVQPTEQPTATAPASVDRALASSGRPLEPSVRQDMEQRFGHDFSRVQVHTGAAAEQSAGDVSAHAYTVGYNIVFGAGQFAPKVRRGRHLLAHELTHVVQQSVGANPLGAGHGDVRRSHSPVPVLQRQSPPNAGQTTPTGIQVAEVLPFGHADLRTDELKRRFRTYLGAVTRLQVTPPGDYRSHCAKEYLTEVANTCPARFAQLRSSGFCTGNKCLEFGRWGTAGDSKTGKTVTDTQDSFIDRHRTTHSESLLEGTGKDSCSVVCHQRFKFDRQRDLGSFYIIRNFRAGQYTPTGTTQPLHITTGEVKKVPASLAAPTSTEFAQNIAPGLVQSGELGEAPQLNEEQDK